jgi:ribosomal protein L6P/L9E
MSRAGERRGSQLNGRLQNVQHIDMSMRVVVPSAAAKNQAHKVKLVVWHGGRKHVACLRTVRSAIENMIQGVRYGFSYKMRLVYAHFPINVIIAPDARSVEIRVGPALASKFLRVLMRARVRRTSLERRSSATFLCSRVLP